MAEKRRIYTDIPIEWERRLIEFPKHYVIDEDGATPYVSVEQVNHLLHYIKSTIPATITVDKKSSGVKVNYDSVLAAVKKIASEGCTGSIHFYKDGEVRIEIT